MQSFWWQAPGCWEQLPVDYFSWRSVRHVWKCVCCVHFPFELDLSWWPLVCPCVPGSDPCELSCLALGHNFYYNFGRVLDGTPCPAEPGAICVNGKCLVRDNLHLNTVHLSCFLLLFPFPFLSLVMQNHLQPVLWVTDPDQRLAWGLAAVPCGKSQLFMFHPLNLWSITFSYSWDKLSWTHEGKIILIRFQWR